ncbi:MAG: hypothetical protein JKX71_01700 [Amylibacter sp.]|nr:hypothetical protein [Amylibacter sp.]
MKAFFKGLWITLLLSITGMILAVGVPQVGVWFGAIFLIVPLLSMIKPIPRIGLTHRGFSLSVAFFVGLTTVTASFGLLPNNQRLAELKISNPSAYLNELKNRNPDKWLSELQELDPVRHATEIAKIEEAETKRKAEVQELQKTKRHEKIKAYMEQLNREIASIPNVQASTYTDNVTSINIGLLLFGAWAVLYEEGQYLDLDAAAQKKRKKFRQILVKKQVYLLPKLRDAYGPAMRAQLWEADGSAKTIGAGYRTVEFVSAAFAANANIKKIHTDIRENLMMLRFTRAQYKWYKGASEFSYYTLKVPKDRDIVKWQNGGRYRVLK